MNRLLLLITITLCSAAISAQPFLDSLRKNEAGKGTVVVKQSQDIDKLVNGTEQNAFNNNTSERAVTTHKADNDKKEPKHDAQEPRHEGHEKKSSEGLAHETKTPSSHSTTTEEPVVDTRKKVMRNSYKTKGYRIQVFSGGNSRSDRQKAETAGAVMKSNFPNEPIYVHFYSPSWKCRMGNYKSYEEARRLLAQVKKLGYKEACIVKGTISVQY